MLKGELKKKEEKKGGVLTVWKIKPQRQVLLSQRVPNIPIPQPGHLAPDCC